jgi:hypothetical protein
MGAKSDRFPSRMSTSERILTPIDLYLACSGACEPMIGQHVIIRQNPNVPIFSRPPSIVIHTEFEPNDAVKRNHNKEKSIISSVPF